MTAGRISLRPMSRDEFVVYRNAFLLDWAADLARIDHSSLEAGLEQATRRVDADLTDGPATPGHFLFTIVCTEDEGAPATPVGTLWFSVDGQNAQHVFLDDVTVDEAARGKGYGRRALELFEAKARALGATRVDLHVYRHNPRAIALYEALGFATTGLKMRKHLTNDRT